MFTTPICLSCSTAETGSWITLEPLNFWSEEKKKHYVVPKDFQTDLASVPRIPLVFWAVGGKAPAGAVVHDWLYRNGMKFKQINDRKEADEVFLEAMISTGVSKTDAYLMYLGVRSCGGKFFKK